VVSGIGPGQEGKIVIAHLLLSLLLSGSGGAAVGAPSGMQAKVPSADATAAAPSMLLEITLERKLDSGKIEMMAPNHVFKTGDQVRLHMKSHYDGYLYVMDQGTTGKFATVFPAQDAGLNNRIRVEKDYYVPAGDDDWFTVSGPSGFDTLYFLLSPSELARPTAASFAAPGPISSMRPRCNDKIFKARGDCMDDSAGLAVVPPGQPLPAPIAPIAAQASRDLTFTKKPGGSTVDVNGGTSAPSLYTFRLAHEEVK
jgi:hypothetical protein